MSSYDAFLLVSFGGPEHPDHVLPFLENVTRGRGVPPERLAVVAEHYHQFGGISPINGQNRALLDELRTSFPARGLDLPLYWGNRNWDPLLPDVLGQMRDDGIERAIAFVTSAFSSYSGCRQYRENIEAAREAVGEGAPVVDKLRVFYDHPGFIEPFVDSTLAALTELDSTGSPGGAEQAELVFTAHSVPMSMAAGCDYEVQLQEAARLVAEAVAARTGVSHPWQVVYQSRSGPPQVPWLEPDVVDHLRQRNAEGVEAAVVVPVGFVSDHLEVQFDLDTEARQAAEDLGMGFARAATPGTDARFVTMIGDLVEERTTGAARAALGTLEIKPDQCLVDCCAAPVRPAASGRPPV
jgi:ferrochelatase